MDYLQPEFYRFNEDSLKLVRKISQEFSQVTNLLDVGAGCGIIGIELAQKMNIENLHLLEVQHEFRPYIVENLHIFTPQQKNSLFITSLGAFKTTTQYDLIVSNPPYYLPGSGVTSSDKRRGICRSFQIDSWKELLELFNSNLALTGSAWVVIKKDKKLLELIERQMRQTKLKAISYSDESMVILKFYLDV